MNEPFKISSRDNPKLVMARKVRDGKIADLIFVEGLRLAEEAVRSALSVRYCLAKRGFREHERGRELIDSLCKADVSVSDVSDSIFDSLAATKNSQGIILIVERPANGRELIESNVGSTGAAIVVFLNEINDPANLGAVFRTAEAAGVAGIVVSSGSADAFSPKAVRAAMGASLRLPVWEDADYEGAVAWARRLGLQITAADTGSTVSYSEFDWTRPNLIVFGSEANGLNAAQLEMVDESVRIPMQNGVESLNLAVSCGIILFEAVKQRFLKG